MTNTRMVVSYVGDEPSSKMLHTPAIFVKLEWHLKARHPSGKESPKCAKNGPYVPPTDAMQSPTLYDSSLLQSSISSFVPCVLLKPCSFRKYWNCEKHLVYKRTTVWRKFSLCSKTQVAIVGGGVAGLTVASILQKYNVDYCLLEAKSYLGGRVATDTVNGFLLDHGFQVFIESYPEVDKL